MLCPVLWLPIDDFYYNLYWPWQVTTEKFVYKTKMIKLGFWAILWIMEIDLSRWGGWLKNVWSFSCLQKLVSPCEKNKHSTAILGWFPSEVLVWVKKIGTLYLKTKHKFFFSKGWVSRQDFCLLSWCSYSVCALEYPTWIKVVFPVTAFKFCACFWLDL